MTLHTAICDDEPEAIDALQKQLESLSFDLDLIFSIDTFTNGKDLLSTISASDEFPYQLLFLDVEISDKNGIEIARSLYRGNDGPWFVEPGEVTHRRVCSLTGLPANVDCPATEDGRALAGRSRAALCPVHCRDMDGNVAGASTENTMYRKSNRLVMPRAMMMPTIPNTVVQPIAIRE